MNPVQHQAVFRRPYVLVADDDEQCGSLVTAVLREIGLATVAVGNGLVALALLAQLPQPLCALLDIDIPGLDGVSVAWTLAARRPDLPVVMMSGRTPDEIRERLGGLAVAGVLPKPFDIRELQALVTRMIRAAS